MVRRFVWCLSILCGPVLWADAGRADQFEQLDGPMLVRLIRGPEATARPSLTVVDLGAMPALLRDSRSALVLARTDAGNPARLLLLPELRKPAGGREEPFPGQVVPEGQGGDVVFRAGGAPGPRLEAIGEARLFTLARPPAFDNARTPQPTPGRAVLPADFAGRYRLFANGQWSGTLDLKAEARGVVTGRFRSDLHGTSYAVTGQVAADAAQKLRFAIAFPRARQEFEGYLWGEGKGAMAGTASLLDRSFGFFAVREGGRYAPEGRDLGPLDSPDADRPGRHLVEINGREIRLDGKPVSPGALTATLKALAEAEAEVPPWASIRTSPELASGDIRKVVEAIRAAGIATIRLDLAATPE